MFRLSLMLLVLLSCGINSSAAADSRRFEVRLDEKVFSQNYSGRVVLFFSKGDREPRLGPNWFNPEPFVSVDVEDWSPGTSLEISLTDPRVRKFPKSLSSKDLNGLSAQAVIRLNPYERNVGTGVGNGYSNVVRLANDPKVTLPIVNIVKKGRPQLSARSKVVTIKSRLLSDFHGRSVEMHATVTVPEGYETDTKKRYPVIYEIPGFGGTHVDRQLERHSQPRLNEQGVDFIKVMLDPSCPRGHHVFANSANNGPYGDALVQELIPEVDRQFRTDARPYGRFLTGHSSGGWSSLWVLVNSPKFFGGTWSTAPDPVDFRDFQQINLYKPSENMFIDSDGKRRPLARMNGRIVLWYDNFAHMEDLLGYGGQLESFEAVFSGRDANGLPYRLWDRETGEIDDAVARSWEKYDINLLLKRNWKALAPALAGKIHIYMGDQDTFYLEGATMLVKETLAGLGSDANVVILPGKTHFDLFANGLSQKIEEEIAIQYLEHRNAKDFE